MHRATGTPGILVNGMRLMTRREFRKFGDQPDVARAALLRQTVTAEVRVLKDEATPDGGERLLEFTVSTDSLDRQGDTIALDGWELANFRRNPVVQWAHDYSLPPVAQAVEVAVRDDALKSTAQFLPEDFADHEHVRLADMLWKMYSAVPPFMRATSVGFNPLEWVYPYDEALDANEETDRGFFDIDFLRQELLEYSLVPVPANAEALMGAHTKGIDTRPLKTWAERVLDGDRKLKGLGWNDLEDAWKHFRSSRVYSFPGTDRWQGYELIRREAAKARAQRERAGWQQPDTVETIVRRSIRETLGLCATPSCRFCWSRLTGGLHLKAQEIQSLIFARSSWSQDEAVAWASDHGFKSEDVDETEESYRLRQFDYPSECEDDTLQTLTENLPEGISAVSCNRQESSSADSPEAKDEPPIAALRCELETEDPRVVAARDALARSEIYEGDFEGFRCRVISIGQDSGERVELGLLPVREDRGRRAAVSSMRVLLGGGDAQIPEPDRLGMYTDLCRSYERLGLAPPAWRHVQAQVLRTMRNRFELSDAGELIERDPVGHLVERIYRASVELYTVQSGSGRPLDPQERGRVDAAIKRLTEAANQAARHDTDEPAESPQEITVEVDEALVREMVREAVRDAVSASMGRVPDRRSS